MWVAQYAQKNGSKYVNFSAFSVPFLTDCDDVIPDQGKKSRALGTSNHIKLL